MPVSPRSTAARLGIELKRLRDAKGLTQRQVAALLGRDVAMVNRWELGKVKPDLPNLERLAGVLETTVMHLLETSGATIVTEGRTLYAVQSSQIPGFSYAAAGRGLETDDMGFPVGGAEFYVERLPANSDPHSFALRARGDSMQPFVPPDWAVVVDTRGTPAPRDLVVAKLAREGDGYEVVVKRYRGRERRSGRVVIVLESANPYAADIEVPPDRVLKIWPVLYTVAPRGQREPHATDRTGRLDET